MEEFREDFVKVEALNGWGLHLLEHLWMLFKEIEDVHLSWNCVFIRFVKYVQLSHSVHVCLNIGFLNEKGIFFLNLDSAFLVILLKDINKYSTLSMLPRDLSQQIFDDLVYSQCLTDSILENFRDCALQVSLVHG